MGANPFEVTARSLKQEFEKLQKEYEEKESKQIGDHKAYADALGVLMGSITQERAKINNDKSLDIGVRGNLLTGYEDLYGDISTSFNKALRAFEAMSPSRPVAEEQKGYAPIPTRKITKEEYDALQQKGKVEADTRPQELVQPMNPAFKRREDMPAETPKDVKIDTRPQELVQPMNPAFKRREPEEPAEAKTDIPTAKVSLGSRFTNWASRLRQKLQRSKSEMSSSTAGVEMTSVQGKKTTASASGDTGAAVQPTSSAIAGPVQTAQADEHYVDLGAIGKLRNERVSPESLPQPTPAPAVVPKPVGPVQPASSDSAADFTTRLKAVDQASTGASMSGPPPNPNESASPATTTTGIPVPKATGPRPRAPTQFEPQVVEKVDEHTKGYTPQDFKRKLERKQAAVDMWDKMAGAEKQKEEIKPADDKPKGNTPK